MYKSSEVTNKYIVSDERYGGDFVGTRAEIETEARQLYQSSPHVWGDPNNSGFIEVTEDEFVNQVLDKAIEIEDEEEPQMKLDTFYINGSEVTNITPVKGEIVGHNGVTDEIVTYVIGDNVIVSTDTINANGEAFPTFVDGVIESAYVVKHAQGEQLRYRVRGADGKLYDRAESELQVG